MTSKMSLELNERILLFGLPAITLLVWTGTTLDPVNLPKMVLLVVIAFSLLYGTYYKVRASFNGTFSIFVVLNLLSIIWIFICTVASNSNYLEGFFGVNGRFTGALTYTSFSIIAISIALSSNEFFQERILATLVFAGVFNLAYCGYVIISGDDPLPWNNIYGNILGTFGNPNFISSFLGIFNIVVFAKILDSKFNLKVVIPFLLLLVSIFQIIDSQSRQGLIVTGAGCGAIFVYKFYCSSKSFSAKLVVLISYLLTGIFSLLGMFQIGPLTSFIYKLSVSIRGAYWRAGWETMLLNPFFGTGPDGFGDWYTRVRDERSLVLPGPNVTTNSPHNIFIEQGVNGGVLLLILFFVTQLYVLSCGLRYIKKSQNYSLTFAASFFGWIGFTAQSLISINQIGLAIWGYVLGALTVAIYRQSLNSSTFDNKKPKKVLISKYKSSSGLASIGALVGLILAIPPFYADAKWRSALESKNLIQVTKAADQWPQSSDRYIQVVKVLVDNKYNDEGLEFVRRGLEFNPQSARLWYFLYQLPGSTESEKLLAIKKLAILDPFFVVE